MALVGSAVCRLCRRTFYGPTAIRVGTGQADPATSQFLVKLGEHMQTAHPKEDGALQLRAFELIGMFRLMNFTISDAGLNSQVDFLRWSFHRQTMMNVIPDEKLRTQTNDLTKRMADVVYGLLTMTFDQRGEAMPEYLVMMKEAIESELFKQLRPILAGIRDIYEEPGKYTVSPVVAPVEKPKLVR
jgi:hypothetical protein